MTSVRTAKSNLNLLMGRSSTADYTVDDSIMLHEIPLLPEILANAQKRSSELQAAESQSVMAKFQQSMARSAFLPKVTVGAEYGVSNSYNGFAIPTEKDPAGMFTGSLRLNWAIFDGRARSTYRNSTSAVSDSEIKAESERLASEDSMIHGKHFGRLSPQRSRPSNWQKKFFENQWNSLLAGKFSR